MSRHQFCKAARVRFVRKEKKKHFISWGDTRVSNKLHNLDFWVNYPSCYYSTLTIFTCAQIMWLYESKDLFWVMTQTNLFTPVYMRLLLLWLFAIVVIFTEYQCTAYIVCCNAMSQYFDCIFDQLNAALVRKSYHTNFWWYCVSCICICLKASNNKKKNSLRCTKQLS